MVDPGVQPYDICAPALLIREAGGRFTSLQGEETIYDGIDRVLLCFSKLGYIFEFMDFAIYPHPDKTLLSDLFKNLNVLAFPAFNQRRKHH